MSAVSLASAIPPVKVKALRRAAMHRQRARVTPTSAAAAKRRAALDAAQGRPPHAGRHRCGAGLPPRKGCCALHSGASFVRLGTTPRASSPVGLVQPHPRYTGRDEPRTVMAQMHRSHRSACRPDRAGIKALQSRRRGRPTARSPCQQDHTRQCAAAEALSNHRHGSDRQTDRPERAPNSRRSGSPPSQNVVEPPRSADRRARAPRRRQRLRPPMPMQIAAIGSSLSSRACSSWPRKAAAAITPKRIMSSKACGSWCA